VIQADQRGLGAAHRETGDRACLSACRDVILPLDARHDFFQQDPSYVGQHVVAQVSGGAIGVAVAERRDDDHR
jgi:hypothetical protein